MPGDFRASMLSPIVIGPLVLKSDVASTFFDELVLPIKAEVTCKPVLSEDDGTLLPLGKSREIL